MTPARYEVFAIPAGGSDWMVYAPLVGRISLTNAAAAREILAYAVSPSSARQTETVNSLIETGFFSNDSIPPQSKTNAYYPTEVTLFPSEKCNLHCSYCYASATEKGRLLDWDIAKAAIEFVFENARRQDSDCSLLFHGGGEPTLGWNVIRKALDYAESLGKQMRVGYRTALASNGTFSADRANEIGERFDSITLSWDGPLHDRQRPFADGRGSLAPLTRNCEILSQHEIDLQFRATITRSNIHTLPDLPGEALEIAPALLTLQVEPSWASGRCSETDKPFAADFVEGFLQAQERANLLGVELAYSGLQPHAIRSSFCSIAKPGFTVLTTGEVSACYETKDSTDPRSRWTHFGKYDHSSGQFIFAPDKINELRKFDVRAYPHCEDCFCKWHCAGDCPVKVIPGGNRSEHHGSERCEINRALTKAFLLNSIQTDQPLVCHSHE